MTRLRAGDWRAYRRLRLAALRESPDAFHSTYAQEAALPNREWRRRAREAAASVSFRIWQARVRRGPGVGLVALRDAGDRFQILSVWVDPGRRKEGVARRLLGRALGAAARLDPGRAVELDVNPRLVPAVRLYSSLGFVRSGRPRPLRPGSGERRIRMIRRPTGAPAGPRPLSLRGGGRRGRRRAR